MQTIYKYPFRIESEFTLVMPQGAKLLYIQEQFGNPYIWALVETDNPSTRRSFRIYGTGHRIDMVGSHVGSFFMNGGNLVWHVFDHGEVFGDI